MFFFVVSPMKFFETKNFTVLTTSRINFDRSGMTLWNFQIQLLFVVIHEKAASDKVRGRNIKCSFLEAHYLKISKKWDKLSHQPNSKPKWFVMQNKEQLVIILRRFQKILVIKNKI